MILVFVGILVIILGAMYAWYRRRLLHPKLKGSKTLKPNYVLPRSRIVAHRGSRGQGYPENSLPAFAAALKSGADAIECDVWLTADKEVVIHHDESLKRMTGVDKPVHSVLFKDLPLLDITQVGSFEKMHEFENDSQLSSPLNRIPKLAEVLALLPRDKAINIEFKQDDWDLVQAVHRILLESGKSHQAFWFSLDEKINKKLRKMDPAIPTVVSILGSLKILGLYHLGLLPFTELDDAVYGITIEEVTLEKVRDEEALKNLPDFVKQFVAWLLKGRPPHIMLQPDLFLHLRRRGVPTWFMTVNDEDDLLLAIRSGATGVLTDRPAHIARLMDEKHMRFRFTHE